SHFEMYLDAMSSVAAQTGTAGQFIGNLQSGTDIFQAIDSLPVDVRVKDFLNYTFSVIQEGIPHKIASAFTFGREELIPDMFSAILKEVQTAFPDTDLSKLV